MNSEYRDIYNENDHLDPEAAARQKRYIPLLRILFVYLKVGAFTFGGGYAMLPIIQREVVCRQKWVDQATFADSLLVTQSLPGPLALNNAIIIGRQLRGTAGGLTAALGVVTPSFLIILVIVAFIFPFFRQNIYVQAIFYGLRPAVVALVAAAAYRLGSQLIKDWQSMVIMAILLGAALFWGLHPILVLVAGGLMGFLFFRKRKQEG